MQFIKNRFAKITLWLIASILVVFICLALALQTSYVQTKVVGYLTTNLSKKTGFKYTIARVSINWFDTITIEGTEVIDPDGNNLGSIESITINYEISSLINENIISIDKIEINKVNMLVTKIYSEEIPSMNITLLVYRIKELLKGKKGGKKIEIDEIEIDKSLFTYKNQEKDSIVNGLDYNHFTIRNIKSEITSFSIASDTVVFTIDTFTGENKKQRCQFTMYRPIFFLIRPN